MDYGAEIEKFHPAGERVSGPLKPAVLESPWMGELMKGVDFNAAGVRMKKVGEVPAEQGLGVASLLVELHREVGAHLHERRGEVATAVTPVVLALADPKRNEQRDFLLDEQGRVQVGDWNFYFMPRGSAMEIGEGQAHYVWNPNLDSTAIVNFMIPNSHFESVDGQPVDKRLVVPPAVENPMTVVQPAPVPAT